MVDYYIERLNESNAVKWEEFNNNSNEGSFFHSLKWKQIIENTLDLRTQYYLLFKNNNVLGILPFVEQKIYLFNGLVPLPGTEYNYAIIRDYSDPSVFQDITKALYNENQRKISFISFSTIHREIIDNVQKEFPVFPYADAGFMTLDLQESPPQKIWDNFSKKGGQRKFIRRFHENGFKVTELKDRDDLKVFYRYFQENMNHLGVKPPLFSHFTYLRNIFSSDEMRIILLSKDSTVAGGALMFTHKPQKTVYLHYLSLNRSLPTTYHPSYYLYWEGINWAWKNNFETVALGGQHKDEKNPRYIMKKNFGGIFKPIYSNMITLTKNFTMVRKSKQIYNRLFYKNRFNSSG
jgi:hypothetical protein